MQSSEEFQQDLVRWAIIYAGAHWPVFPLHSPQRAPRQVCDCPDTDKRPGGNRCERAAKHPRTQHGLLDATCDTEQIQRWWRQWPRANVGIAVPQGYVVLDVDGIEGLSAIAEEGWSIPETVTASTARGWHYWFTAEVEVRPGSWFLDHVDLRGPGGYVVAPPSLHATGALYEWERSPIEVGFAEAPEWLFELVRRARERRHAQPEAAAGGPITEGGRNDTLTRVAGFLRRFGASEELLLKTIFELNQEVCVPTLELEECAQIARSVSRYQPEPGAPPPIWDREPW